MLGAEKFLFKAALGWIEIDFPKDCKTGLCKVYDLGCILSDFEYAIVPCRAGV